MRKLFIAITAAMSLLSASAEVTYKYDSSTKTLTFSGTGAVPDVTLWYEDGQFKEWNSREWSDYQEEAEKVVFEEGITALGGGVIGQFINVTEVSLPSTLVDLGMGSLSGMTSLKSIELPAGLKTIGMRCFKGSGLESIVIPDGVTKFEAETFQGCKSLESVVAKNVTEFGVSTFNQTALKSYDLPEGTTVLPAGLFYRIKTMESIVIPASVKTIDQGVFSYSNVSKVIFKGDKLPEFIEEWGNDYYLLDEDGNVLLDEDGYKRIKSIYYGLGWNAFNGNYNARNFYLSCSAYTDDAIKILKEKNDGSISVLPLLAADINISTDYYVKDFKIEHKDCSKNVLTFTATPPSGKCMLWEGTVAEGLEDKTVTSFDYEVKGAATLEANLQKCEANMQATWSYDEETKTLKITGDADNDYSIPNNASAESVPWIDYVGQVENLKLSYLDIIGDHSFDGLSKVTSIDLGYSVKKLGDYVFANTASLEKIVFNTSNVPEFSSNTFSGIGDNVVFVVSCDDIDAYKEALPDLADRFVGEGKEAYISVTRGSGVGSVSYSVVEVGCGNTTVRLTATPGEGESFVEWSFQFEDPTILKGTISDPEIEVSSVKYLVASAKFTGSVTSGKDGNISWRYDAENDELIVSGTGEMNDYLESQPWEALDDVLSTVKKVTVEEGITSLGAGAFMYMEGVESISLPKTLKKIGDAAIYQCTSLTSIIIPENVEEIDNHNFIYYDENYDDYYMDRIEFKGTVPPTIDENTLDNILEAENINYPCGSKDEYEELFADADESQLKCSEGGDDEPGDLPSLDEFTFDPANVCGAEGDGSNILWAYDEATKTLAMKGTGKMQDYGTRSKRGWKNLDVKNLIVSEGITTIGERAFFEQSSLENVYLPSTIDSILYYAFASTSSMKKVVLSEGVKVLDDNAFYGTGLTEITFPSTLQSIGNYAFQYCQFTSVVIPESVTFIGHGAFYNSGTLESVVFESETPAETGEGYTIVTTAGNTIGHVVKLIVPCDAVEAYKEHSGYQAEYVQGEFPYTLTLSQTTDTYVGSDLGGKPQIQQWPDCETGEAIVSVYVKQPYKFSHWEATGVTLTEDQAKSETITFVVDADCVLTAIFKTISDVDDVDADDVVVIAEDGRISVNRNEFQIVDVLGRDVTSANGSLRTGVYVVKCDGQTFKAVVK